MPIKSVLSWVDRSEHAQARLTAAIAAAIRFDAHLSVAAIAFEPDIPFEDDAGLNAYAQVVSFRETAEAEAKALARETLERVKAENLRGDAFALVTTVGGLAAQFGARARFVDLVVLTRDDMLRPGPAARQCFEAALFDGIAAVLVSTEATELRPERVMIAWDGGSAAMRAVRRAHPFLAEATDLQIVLVDPTDEQMRSAEDLAVMLSRHGLTPDVIRMTGDGRSEAEALKQHAVESRAQFAVMGAFGHSRFRELVFGGVTREYPGLTTCPVLLAH